MSHDRSIGLCGPDSASLFLRYRLEVGAVGFVENSKFSCSLEEG